MSDFERKNLPDEAVIIQDSGKKKSSKRWYWLGLVIVLLTSYMVKEIRDDRVYKKAQNQFLIMESNIEKSSTEEVKKLEKLQVEVIFLCAKYLSEDEFNDMQRLMKIGTEYQSQEEFKRGTDYILKVKSMCSSDELKAFQELEYLAKKLADLTE